MANGRLGKYAPTLALLLVAIVWGFGFIATQVALDSGLSSGLILVFRFLIASVMMLLMFRKRIFPLKRLDLKYGLAAGFFLFLGFYSQTVGLRFTTPSNNGFFTATNVIMVPFLSWLILKKRPPGKLFLCCVTVLAGCFILGLSPGVGFSVNGGDMLSILSAFFFACHIAGLEYFLRKVDPVRMTFLQISIAGVFSVIGYLILERDVPPPSNIAGAAGGVLFLGLFSTFLCFFIQNWAQSKTSSGKAALIISGESMWCMVFSVLLGYEALTPNMVIGGLMIVGSVILLEAEIRLPWKKKLPETPRPEEAHALALQAKEPVPEVVEEIA